MSYRIPGQPEPGTHCPSCDWPLHEKSQRVAISAIPGKGLFNCPHCGWPHDAAGNQVPLTTPRHGNDDHRPQPGWPSSP
jgi:hypothetical protein